MTNATTKTTEAQTVRKAMNTTIDAVIEARVTKRNLVTRKALADAIMATGWVRRQALEALVIAAHADRELHQTPAFRLALEKASETLRATK